MSNIESKREIVENCVDCFKGDLFQYSDEQLAQMQYLITKELQRRKIAQTSVDLAARRKQGIQEEKEQETKKNKEQEQELKQLLNTEDSIDDMTDDEMHDFSQMVECCFKSHYGEDFNMDNEGEEWGKYQEMIQMIEKFNDPQYREEGSEMTKEQFEDWLIDEVYKLMQQRADEQTKRRNGDILQQFFKGLKYMQDTYFKDKPEKIDPLGNCVYQIKEQVQRYAYL